MKGRKWKELEIRSRLLDWKTANRGQKSGNGKKKEDVHFPSRKPAEMKCRGGRIRDRRQEIGRRAGEQAKSQEIIVKVVAETTYTEEIPHA